MKLETHRNPVLLVHGIFRRSGVFWKLAAYLRQQGWLVYTLNLSIGDRALGLEDFAKEVAEFVERTFPPEQSFDLVGFSMGGLVSRYYLQRLGGCDRVRRFVTISTPHNGTWMAYAIPSKTCVQMRPGSSFLVDLNADLDKLDKVKFTSIWTDWDFIIVPGNSSVIPGVKMVKLPVLFHANMVISVEGLAAVAQVLREGHLGEVGCQ